MGNRTTVRASDLRDLITFQRQTDEEDGYGNVKGAFADLLCVRADMRETPGREAVASGVVESTRTATIRVRYSSATACITPADRVIARGAIWNIRSGPVRIGHRAELLEFLCETGVAT